MKIEYLLKILVLWMVILLPVGAHSEDLGALRLSQMAGDIQIQSTGADEWYPATINLPLQTGDRLWVPKDAWAQVETRDGSFIRLDAESSLEILAVEQDSLQLYLAQGQVYLNFKQRADSMLQVDTPVASIRVYDSSTFNVALAEDGNTNISVFRGAVYAENRSGAVRVSAGKMLSIGDDLPTLMTLGPPSEWERWNKDWDEALAVDEESVQYLPQELSVYGRDLNSNGRWIETSEYGYVWTPTVYISADWAPYRYGRWVWIGDDYVWIAHEPWGWAPYHYGRWAHISSHGWCWVPPPRNEVYWGPGYVSWVETEHHVAWVPLAPAEVYYGHGYYGPHSVNITNININTVRVPGVNYRNIHVRDAVTVINRDTFSTGHNYDVVRQGDNPFLRERINIGRPGIKPGRINKMPMVRDIPREHQPPANLRTLLGRTVDEARPMVRERDRSIFTPTVAPQPLTPTVRMNPDQTTKQTEGRTLSPDERKQILEHSVMPGQLRARPPIDRKADKTAPLPATVKPRRELYPAPGQARPDRKDEKTAPIIRERPQVPEQDVRPEQFRGRPAIDREAVKSEPPPATVKPQRELYPAPDQVRPDRKDEKKAPVIRERPQVPENVRPEQFRGRPAIDRETVKSAPPPATVRPQAPPAPVIRERPQMPEQYVRPEQFRGRPTIDREAIKSAPPPATVRPQAPPAPAIRERPQMPEQYVRPEQFRGRPAIDREAVKSAPPPAPVRPQNVPSPPVNIRPQNAPPPAPARSQIAPPPVPGPAQVHLDAEALKRLKEKQEADKKEKK